TIRSVEYAIQSFEESIGNLERDIKETKKRIADLSIQSEQPFEYGEKLSSLIKRQQEITDSLDLTKNQASSQLESEAPEQAAAPSEESALVAREIDFPEYD